MPKETNSTGLKYRGKGSLDISPKEKTAKGIFFSYGSFEKSSYSSITESPAYQNPPSGAKASYAYDYLENVTSAVSDTMSSIAATLNIVLPKDQPTTLKNAQNAIKEFQEGCQKFKSLITAFYKQCSKEDKAFIKLIASRLARYHISQFIMGTLNLNPITFTILSLSFWAKGSFAEFAFHNGFPKNGTDLCLEDGINRPFKPILCEQFYVTENGLTLSQGSAQFSVIRGWASRPDLLERTKAAWPCGDRNHTINALIKVLNDSKIIQKFGNCNINKISSSSFYEYRDGPFMRELPIDVDILNKVTGLSENACAALEKELDVPITITQCMEEHMPEPTEFSCCCLCCVGTFGSLFGLAALSWVGYGIYDGSKKLKEKCCPDASLQSIKEKCCGENPIEKVKDKCLVFMHKVKTSCCGEDPMQRSLLSRNYLTGYTSV